MNKLRAWYAGLQQREQRAVMIGTIALAVLLLVGGVLLPLHSAVSHAVAAGNTKREDLAWMRINASEIRGNANLVPIDDTEAPVVLVNRLGQAAGLTDALRGTQPNGTTGVRVQLEGASFDDMIAWLANLDQRYGFAIESITVDRAAKPGIVNASITFAQSPR